MFLPNDTDATFDWMALNDQVGVKDHPVYFWEGRGPAARQPSGASP